MNKKHSLSVVSSHSCVIVENLSQTLSLGTWKHLTTLYSPAGLGAGVGTGCLVLTALFKRNN